MTGYARSFRWIVFLLAAGYCLWTLVFGSYEHFGGPFRYLTHWALFMSFFSASRMTALVEGRSARCWDGFICATAVINAMVVFMYWRLFLEDPNLVPLTGSLGRFTLSCICMRLAHFCNGSTRFSSTEVFANWARH